MNKRFIYLIFRVFFAGCRKESLNKIDVSGITETDAFGNVKSTVDNTDWTGDTNWTSEESSLFINPPDSLLVNTEATSVSISPASPNPSQGIIGCYLNASKKTMVELVVVDGALSVKDRYFMTLSIGTEFRLKLDDGKYSNNTNYRVYYGFYSLSHPLYYKGHGDIKISR